MRTPRGRPDRLSGEFTTCFSPSRGWRIGVAMPRCRTCGSANTLSIVLIGPQGIPAPSKSVIQCSAGLVCVTAPMAALISARCRLRPTWLLHSGFAAHSGWPIVSQNRCHSRPPLAAMLICPSLVGNTPVGMPVGWSLPACPATSPAISQREAWKSSMKTCASSSDVCTQRPSPVRSRSKSAIMMPSASRLPAVRSSIGMPTRTGPCPGKPVIDISPPSPCAIWSTPARFDIGPVLTEAADAAIDDARIVRPHVVIGDLQPVLHVGAHVLDDDVRAFGEPHERRMALLRLEVEPDRALVAVQVLVVEPVAVAGDVLPARGGRLDADHLRAPIREMAHAGRPGARQGQVQHGDAGERQAGFRRKLLVGDGVRHHFLPAVPASVPQRMTMDKVDLALVLAVDGSASVTYDEFNLICGGMAAALRDPAIARGLAGERSREPRRTPALVRPWRAAGGDPLVPSHVRARGGCVGRCGG